MKERISPEKRAFLLERDREMERLEKEGYDFHAHEDKQPVDEQDGYLAFHTMMNDLVLELWDIRREKGLTQADLAQKMGTKQTAVSRFENSGITPSFELAFKYAWALGLKLAITTHGEYTLTLPKELWKPMEIMAECAKTTVQQVMSEAIEDYVPSQYSNYVFKMLSASCQPQKKVKFESLEEVAV